MPAVAEVQAPEAGVIGVSTENGTNLQPSLGVFDSVAQQTHSLTLFNRGKTPVDYRITTSDPWIVVSGSAGTVKKDEMIQVHVDWSAAPADRAKGTVTLTQQSAPSISVQLESLRLSGVTRENAHGFIESDGYVAIDAADTTRRSADQSAHWEDLPGYGETGAAVTVFPVTAPAI